MQHKDRVRVEIYKRDNVISLTVNRITILINEFCKCRPAADESEYYDTRIRVPRRICTVLFHIDYGLSKLTIKSVI